MKETRALFWPWCIVSITGALPWLLSGFSHFKPGVLMPFPSRVLYALYGISGAVALMVFLLGIPLLAALSLGNEFQHRTLSLMLSQPIDRMKIWAEKFAVTLFAVLSAALIYYVGNLRGMHPPLFVLLGFAVWLVTTTGSAAFWTLGLRSTLLGYLANLMVQFLLVFPGPLHWLMGPGLPPAEVSIGAMAVLCYAGIMLWLGRRVLVRFQPATGMAAGDLQMADSKAASGVFRELLRSRPSGAFFNLIRKDLRLLKPLWLFTIVLIPASACLAFLYGFIHNIGDVKMVFTASTIMLGLYVVLAPVLAGSLSMSEERALDTHAWHMTLPVSIRLQWFSKLATAALAGLVCTVVLPFFVISLTQFVLGSKLMDQVRPSGFPSVRESLVYLFAAWLVSLAAFWCASVVNSTMKAVLLVFCVVGCLVLSGAFGISFAESLRDGPLLDWMVARIPPLPFTTAALTVLRGAAWMWLVVPALLLALAQSYRLFRLPPQDSIRFAVRYVMPVAILTFACGYSVGILSDLVNRSYLQAGIVLQEIDAAVEKPLRGITKEFNAEDLRTFSLSETTRRWLSHSTIKVAYQTNVTDLAQAPGVFTTIHFADGFDCTMYRRGEWRCTSPGHRWWGSFVSTSDEEYYSQVSVGSPLDGFYGNVIRIP